MVRIFSKANQRSLAVILVLFLVPAMLPLSAGLALIGSPGHAELSLDICHPLQTFDRTPSMPIARPASAMTEFVLLDFGAVSVFKPADFMSFNSPPESPPPELSA